MLNVMMPHINRIISHLCAGVNRLRIDNFSGIILKAHLGEMLLPTHFSRISLLTVKYRGTRMNFWKLLIGVFLGFFAIFSIPIHAHQSQINIRNLSSEHFFYEDINHSDELVLNGGLEDWNSGAAGPPDHWTYNTGLSVEQTTEEEIGRASCRERV